MHDTNCVCLSARLCTPSHVYARGTIKSEGKEGEREKERKKEEQMKKIGARGAAAAHRHSKVVPR